MPDLPHEVQPREDRAREDRPRDSRGRAQNDRPRDGLGRPLPLGSAGVPRQPEGVVRTPGQTLALAQELLDARKPFHAHDVFEDQWKHRADAAEANLWRALAQLAVGITHAARGNIRGAVAVLERAAANLDPYGAEPPHRIAAGPLAEWARGRASELDPESNAPVWLDTPELSAR